MHQLRFALAPGEEEPLLRLSKSLSLCEEIMNVLFAGKKINISIHFWNASEWRVSQAMLIICDIINSSGNAEVKNILNKGVLKEISINVYNFSYKFEEIKGLLSIFLSAELGIFSYIDMSICFNANSGNAFRPYDDRGADAMIKNKKLYTTILEMFKSKIIDF